MNRSLQVLNRQIFRDRSLQNYPRYAWINIQIDDRRMNFGFGNIRRKCFLYKINSNLRCIALLITNITVDCRIIADPDRNQCRCPAILLNASTSTATLCKISLATTFPSISMPVIATPILSIHANANQPWPGTLRIHAKDYTLQMSL